MSWNRALRVVLLLACGVISLLWASATSHRQETLQSFYIARFYFSDYIPGWGDSLLDVAPQGDGVRVRLIHINQANDYCPGVIVRAAEHTFPNTPVSEVAGGDMCPFTSKGVAAALKAAAPKYVYDISDSATQVIVAMCGAVQKEFDFPYPLNVDRTVLKRRNSKVADLWDTYYRIYLRAFGNLSFNKLTPEQEKQMEQLGTELVPELMSGRYQAAYVGSRCGDHDCDNFLAWQLRGYADAPKPYDPGVANLLDAAALPLTKYVAPTMSPLAKLARIHGDVRLHIVVDPQTGLVTNVEAVSGHPLLAEESIKAAQSWQFAPETLSREPIEVTLRFELQCH